MTRREPEQLPLGMTHRRDPETSREAAERVFERLTPVLDPGRSWSVPSRPRVDKHPLQEKWRWEAPMP